MSQHYLTIKYPFRSIYQEVDEEIGPTERGFRPWNEAFMKRFEKCIGKAKLRKGKPPSTNLSS